MEKGSAQSSFLLLVVEIHGLVPRWRFSKKENLHAGRLPTIVHSVASKWKIIEDDSRSIPLIDLNELPVLLKCRAGVYHDRIELRVLIANQESLTSPDLFGLSSKAE